MNKNIRPNGLGHRTDVWHQKKKNNTKHNEKAHERPIQPKQKNSSTHSKSYSNSDSIRHVHGSEVKTRLKFIVLTTTITGRFDTIPTMNVVGMGHQELALVTSGAF